MLVDPKAAAQARAALRDCGSSTRVESGAQALADAAAAANVHMVMAAIVGAAGLTSTLAAVRAGKRVLLANKEALVMAGPLLMDEVRRARRRAHSRSTASTTRSFNACPAAICPGTRRAA